MYSSANTGFRSYSGLYSLSSRPDPCLGLGLFLDIMSPPQRYSCPEDWEVQGAGVVAGEDCSGTKGHPKLLEVWRKRVLLPFNLADTGFKTRRCGALWTPDYRLFPVQTRPRLT